MLEFMQDVEGMRRKLIESGMSEEELEEAIRRKKEEFSGLINERAALYILLKEKGLDYQLFLCPPLAKIGELREGMKANVRGRVERLYSLKTFERNGRKGSVLSAIISDETGRVRLVLWDKDAESVDRGLFGKGDLIEVMNGIVKSSASGLEIHLPMSGSVRKVGESEKVKVKDLKEEMRSVNMVLRVLEVGSKSEFAREGGKGKVSWCLAGDETGTLRLVLWDEKADIIDRMSVNDVVKVEDGYVKNGTRGLEVHVGIFGRVIINPPETDVADRRKILNIPLVRLSEAEEGKEVEVHVNVREVEAFSEAWACPSCGLVKGSTCEKCGGKAERRLFMKAIVEDEGGRLMANLQGRSVLKLLGLKALPPDVALETLLRLKGAELKGARYYFLGRRKGSEFEVERVLGRGQ